MEDVLDVYKRPYDAKRPLVCMDESSQQLIGEVRSPIGMRPGACKRVDDEYVRNGVANIFLAIEPLTGQYCVELTEHRGRKDWAKFIQHIVDVKYAQAEKVVLVMDNLNTHEVASLYEVFSPDEAHRIKEKLEIHYTPKHGSWLDIAEIGLSVLKAQALKDRIATLDEMKAKVAAWVKAYNGAAKKINWQFTTEDARVKLRRLYPEIN